MNVGYALIYTIKFLISQFEEKYENLEGSLLKELIIRFFFFF